MLHYIKKSYISGQSAKLYLYSAHEKPVKYAKEVEAILKRISVKFQQQEQTYRSLHAAARSLLSSKGRVFLLFLLFYKVLTNFLFVPALQLIWALTLRFAPIRYLNNKTASRIFVSPAIIGCIVVLAVLAAFWSLYEVAAMLQLLTRVRHGEPLRVGVVFRDAFRSLVRVFLPQNLPLLLYGIALIPLTNFFLAANHLTQFAVPEYLWGLLKARAANRLLFALAVLFVLALLLDGLVVLPKFLLERKSFGCAFAESLHILRSRTGQLLALALRWMLTAAARTGLMLLCGATLFYCVILGIGFASTAALLALSRAALLIELPFLCLLMDCAMTAAQSTLTEVLYKTTRQPDTAQPTICSASPAPHREQTVLAGMMACAALVTCGVAAVYLLFPQTQPLQSVLGLSDPVITYHRGYSSRAPENTMAAFETALKHGSPRIELDVQMTADGVAVVTHDTSLRRCTGCNANIYDLPYAQVQQLDAGRWFHRQFTGSYIPTLEEVLALCKGKAELNIEIKPSTFTPTLEAETVRLIHAYDYGADCVVTSQSYETLCKVQQLDAGRWFHRQFTGSYIPTLEEVLALCKGKAELNIEIKPSTFTPTLEAETVRLIHAYDYGADCVVTSQSYETLCKVKELDPDITTGYILALGVGTYYDLPAADFFSVESTFITAGMVQQIHLRGKTISAWTINRQQDAEKLLQLGVDDLITDKPEIIAPLLARDKALDNRLLWLRDQIQELLAAPDAEETMEVEETIEDAIEDPEEVLDEA